MGAFFPVERISKGADDMRNNMAAAHRGFADQIADVIVAQNTPDVDAIAGATLTSDTVKKAVEDALMQGQVG